jgi:putative flavoprotein involved in K+ transport
MSPECVVVGAGPAGLAASVALTARGVDHEVLERSRVGETWRTRWDSFRLNTPGHLNPLLGPAPEDEYTPRDEVVRRLESLASSCPVRTGIAVTALDEGRGALTLGTSDGPLRTRAVVVATGAENQPRVPALAAGLPDDIRQQAVGTYRSPEELPPGAVLVVGSGQSGVQVALDLQSAGRRVLLSTSPVGRLPSPYRGRATIAWLATCGFFDQRPGDVPEDVRRAPNPVLLPSKDGADLRRMARDGVALLGRVTEVAGARVRVDGSTRANLVAADAFALRSLAFVDEGIARLGLEAPPAEPEHPETSHLVRDEGWLDLRDENVTSVVWCTGMRSSLGWMPPDLVDARGVPRHENGAAPVPGLFYMGVRWMRRRGSSNIVGMPADAAAIADRVVAHLAA